MHSERTSTEEFTFCTACGCSPPRNPHLANSIIQAEAFVVIGQKSRKPVTRFFRIVQEQARQPLSFGRLCEALRNLPKELVTPRTVENPAMVICERIQYALKNGILDLCSPSALRETQALIIRKEQEAEDTGAFNPLNLKDDRQRTIATIVRRRGQPEFRQRLLCAYGSRCAVTGCDAVEALEAAHIVPYQGKDTDHVSNGLILRSDVHTLFDLGLLTIDADSWTVVLRSELLGTTYGQLHGKRISLPVATTDIPSGDALRLHRTNCGL